MELSALVGTPTASNVPAEEGAGMSSVTGEEIFDPLDFLRELEAEASQPTSTTTPSSYKRQRHNIAAANPLLAGELHYYYCLLYYTCAIHIGNISFCKVY